MEEQDKELIEKIAEIWRSGKDYSQVFDFHECSRRQRWVARLYAISAQARKQVIEEIKEYAIGARMACVDGREYQKKTRPNEKQAVVCYGCKMKAFQQIIDKCVALQQREGEG